jgi:hypothetical protein
MKLILYTFLLFIPLNICGQDNIPCTLYEHTDKDTISSVNSFGNYLYVGIDNEVEVNKENIPYKSIFLTTNNGDLYEDNDKFYTIPSVPGTCVIKIFKVVGNDTSFVFLKQMVVKPLPAPYLAFNDIQLSTTKAVTKSFLLQEKPFEIHLSKDFVIDTLWFTVKEITLGYTYGKYYVSKTCTGNHFSKQLKEEINKLQPGREIDLVMKVKSSENMYKTMSVLKLKVY